MEVVRRYVVLLVMVALLISNSCLAAVATTGDYYLGVGDVLNIQVAGLDNSANGIVNTNNANTVSASTVNYNAGSSGYMIRPDGKFEFSLIGEIDANGKTISELNKEISLRLSEYIVNPRVAINVSKFHTTRVYVLGETVKPGLYELEREHNLVDAIGIAGGYTKYAAKKTVFVIRNNQKDKPISCNLLNYIEKGDTSQNIELQNGDVIYLSNNGKIDWNNDIFPWFQATANAATTVATIYAVQGK